MNFTIVACLQVKQVDMYEKGERSQPTHMQGQFDEASLPFSISAPKA